MKISLSFLLFMMLTMLVIFFASKPAHSQDESMMCTIPDNMCTAGHDPTVQMCMQTADDTTGVCYIDQNSIAATQDPQVFLSAQKPAYSPQERDKNILMDYDVAY